MKDPHSIDPLDGSFTAKLIDTVTGEETPVVAGPTTSWDSVHGWTMVGDVPGDDGESTAERGRP